MKEELEETEEEEKEKDEEALEVQLRHFNPVWSIKLENSVTFPSRMTCE
ncbi:unnamed protein product [Mesocestoides corti]|uniref:Uncharacterized protein n=1 Tax=Mesocestoides corti TaxID=53468 RepID=A0A0R3UC44_MESCO|nr:unnamed protein product [Mesocestoides corti]